MNLNITVDLQDIFDAQNEIAFQDGVDNSMSEGSSSGSGGYDLKETIKYEIINGIKSKISKDCFDLVAKKSKEGIEEAINESVSLAKETIQNKALSFVDEWLDKKVVVSDKWGDPVNELTISELVKQQFDNLLETKVDSNGIPTSYRGEKLINHLTGKLVQEEVSKRFKDFNRNIDNQIKAHIESGIKESVANKFAEMVVQTAKSQNKSIGSN